MTIQPRNNETISSCNKNACAVEWCVHTSGYRCKMPISPTCTLAPTPYLIWAYLWEIYGKLQGREWGLMNRWGFCTWYTGVAFWQAQYSTTPTHATVNTCSIPVCLMDCTVHTKCCTTPWSYKNGTETDHATLVDVNGYKLPDNRMDSVPIKHRSQCHPLTSTVTVVQISVLLSVLLTTP